DARIGAVDVIPDLAFPQDFARAPLDVTGRFASRFSLDLTVDTGAGAKPQALPILVAWAALQKENPAPLTVAWQLCSLPVPGLGAVPFAQLDTVLLTVMNATLSEYLDGATFTQPEIAFVF